MLEAFEGKAEDTFASQILELLFVASKWKTVLARKLRTITPRSLAFRCMARLLGAVWALVRLTSMFFPTVLASILKKDRATCESLLHIAEDPYVKVLYESNTTKGQLYITTQILNA